MNKCFYLKGHRIHWEPFGWSYAVPVVSIPETRWWRRLFGIRWRRAWLGEAIPYLVAVKKLPDEIEGWYHKALIEYLQYLTAWKNERWR